MAASIFFEREGRIFWKCSCCGHEYNVGLGTFADAAPITIGGNTIGVSCKTCLPGITLRMKNLFNHRLPEVA